MAKIEIFGENEAVGGLAEIERSSSAAKRQTSRPHPT